MVAVFAESEGNITIESLTAIYTNLYARLGEFGFTIWLYRHLMLLMKGTCMFLCSRILLREAPVDIYSVHLPIMQVQFQFYWRCLLIHFKSKEHRLDSLKFK